MRNYAEKHGLPDAYCEDMEPHRVVLLSHIRTCGRSILRCAGAENLRMAIRTGQGIGPMPTFDCDRVPEHVRCFDSPEGSFIQVWLVISPEAHLRAGVRKFSAYAAPSIALNLKQTLFSPPADYPACLPGLASLLDGVMATKARA